MIDAKELRIGNKVKCKISNDAGIYTVLAIPMWSIDAANEEPLILIDRCPQDFVVESKLKPIPLTEEWLLKFGFEKGKECIKSNVISRMDEKNKEGSSYDDVYSIDNKNQYLFIVPRLQMQLMGKHLDKNIEMDSFFIGDSLLYVHQLQNLYLALTGIELQEK